jgi:lysophospholipase L1-like esterase
MLHNIALVLLAPVFFAQGAHVRKVTLKLPEAQGDRSGIIGHGSTLNIVIIGDSAAAGVGVEQQAQALSGKLLNNLRLKYRLQWQLLATSGHNTEQCIGMLEQQAISIFDIVVISLGVNDVLSKLTAKQWVSQQHALIKLLRQRFNTKHILLTKIPPMNQFPALPQPLRWYLGARCHEFNDALAHSIIGQQQVDLIDLTSQVSGEHMASDGFHPGEVIYDKWGEALALKINQHWS